MLRVFIFFAFVLASTFLVVERRESFSALFADSSKVEIDNKKLSAALSSMSTESKSKIKLLNFWASWCSPCMRELPSLNRLNALYKDNGLEIITVNSDYENQDRLIKKIKNELNLDLNIVKDIKGNLTELFEIEGLPVTILFKNNRLLEKINGEIDFDSQKFRKKIDLLLQSAESSSGSKSN